MDIGRAFGSITEDEKWVSKILLGGLILLIPIVGLLALTGFMLEVARNVAQGNPRPIPGWDNFGDKISRGFYAMLIALVYSIPVDILSALFQPKDGGISLLSLVVMLLGVATEIVIFAAYVRYLKTDSLSEALKFSEVFALVQSSFMTWLTLFGCSIICGLVVVLGFVGCGIGILFTYVYGGIAFGHMLGQVAAQINGQYPPTSYVNPGA
jgi:hypothetical protein